MSRFFVNRPIFASVVSIIIVLLGALAYFRLPVEEYPELAPPVVRVEAQYPGANAQTIADTVAAPLEQEINGVDRMIYMASTSSDGRYQLDISFESGTDVDLAAVLVQNRVGIAEPKLPEETRRLGITTRKQSTSLAAVISITAEDPAKHPEYDDLYLANFMSIRVRDEISRVYGVGGVNIFPAKDYGMRVWLDPERLKARSLTVDDVNAAIREQNVQVAAGVLGRQPAPKGTDFELTITTLGRLTDPEQFGDIIVKRYEDGSAVHVRDVARVELGARDYSTVARFNGKQAAIMPIYQLPGTNLVEVARNVEATMHRLEKDFPPGLKASFFYDPSMFIRSALHEVNKTLIEAFVLVFLVVLVFLQSLRTTLIPALTIPVSLIGTFLVMAVLGFSVNTLTMFGLVLAIGIVVDDAIIVVENVERNMREHKLPAKEATIRAMGEITGPVIAVTLVLMAVFIPTAALGGLTGRMYRQFALTIAASTGLSAICALTLSPALCALILKAHDHDRPAGPVKRLLTWPGRAFNRAFDAATGVYAWTAHLFVRAWPLALLGLVGVLGLTAYLYTRVPTGFVPDEDLGFVVVSAQLPDAASLERSDELIARVASEVRKVDGVKDVTTLSGFSIIDGQGSAYANAWVVLEPWDVRVPKHRGIQQIMADIREKTSRMQESQFLIVSLPTIRGLGNASGFDMRLVDRASAGRAALLQGTTETIQAASGQSAIAYAFSSFRMGVPQIYLDIDREKALKIGVPLSGIFETLQTSLGSTYVNDFNLFNRTFQVSTQADARFRLQESDILRLETRNVNGEMVPLSTLVSSRSTIGPDRVTRYNLYPSATINGAPRPGVSSGEALKIMEAAANDKLPPGIGYEWTGMSFQEKRVGREGLVVFALGILLVYLVLAAQYESWTIPLAVVLSVPLVVIGAIVALTIAGLDNNVFTQIGLVLLVGLGAKNAILIVEFAKENRARGVSIVESAITAARVRLRPIVMTAMAFILGVLPLVLATGAGANGRRSLGTAVFGGMIGNTVLALLFTPVLYVVIQSTTEWVRRRVRGTAPEASSTPHTA